MLLDRRSFLARAGLVVAAGGAASSCREPLAESEDAAPTPQNPQSESEWEAVRNAFALSDDFIHMSALLISSHPRPVREAIAEHRRELDANPVVYLNSNNRRLQQRARNAAGKYLGVAGSHIALTDSTTMGIGLVYNGLRLRPGQEILSTEEDYYVTHEAIRLASERTGATVRQIALFEKLENASAEEIVDRIAREVRPATRVLALTWVHSSTGLKLPLADIARAVERINNDREDEDRVLVCVDGVHGFGNQDFTLSKLGCDFFMAGCHKWLFGPRGTGIVAATRHAWRAVRPTIPSFIDDGAWQAWLSEREPQEPTDADAMTPGGFKPFEHQWAMTEAFEFHQTIGKSHITKRTHQLAAQLKEGLAKISGVVLRTPRSENLSAGIVSFDVSGASPRAVVRRLREKKIVASVAPYSTQHVRLTPSVRNTPAEIEKALEAVRAVAGSA